MQEPWPRRTSGPRADWEPSRCWLWRFMGGIESYFHPLLRGEPKRQSGGQLVGLV